MRTRPLNCSPNYRRKSVLVSLATCLAVALLLGMPGKLNAATSATATSSSTDASAPVDTTTNATMDTAATDSGAIPDGVGVLQGGITTLRLHRGRSQIIKFAQPIRQISIADPTLADVVPLSPQELIINGKQPGVTSLIVWDEKVRKGFLTFPSTTTTRKSWPY